MNTITHRIGRDLVAAVGQGISNTRGDVSGHYNDRRGKSGGDEERGRERKRVNERDRNRDSQCDVDSARYRGCDSDRDSVLEN
jgi:hypothetical protein